MVLVPDIGDTTRHTGREVTSGLTEDHHPAACHVLTAVVAGTFEHGDSTGVTHTETLTDFSVDIELTGGGSIETCVTCDDIVFCIEVRTYRWKDSDATATETFREIVVGLAL